MLADLVAAWNARSGEAVAAAYAADGVRREFALPGIHLVGRRAIADHVQAYMDALPDCRLVVRGVSALAEVRAVLEWTFVGTHLQDLPGLPALGEQVALDGVSVCEMDRGLIREERVYWDAATLLAGAGVLDQV